MNRISKELLEDILLVIMVVIVAEVCAVIIL